MKVIGKCKRTYETIFYSNSRDAKLYFLRHIVIPLVLFFYLWRYPHSRLFKTLVFLIYFYFHFRIPKPTKRLDFKSIIFGHRCCGSSEHVENSLDALGHAIKSGFTGIEVDVQLTKDYVPVIFHDVMKMDRILEIPENLKKKFLPINRRIGTFSINELKQCTYKSSKSENTLKHQTVPTLEEFLEEYFMCLEDCKKEDKRVILMLEVKLFSTGKRAKEMVNRIIEVFEKYPVLYRNAFIASFSPYFLYLVRKREKRIETCLISHKSLFSSHTDFNFCLCKILFKFLDLIFYVLTSNPIILTFLGVSIVAISSDVNESRLKRLQEQYNTICWTVNEREERERLTKMDVSIIADYIL